MGLAVDPEAGVVQRGFWSYYARALAAGGFSDLLEATSAFRASQRLGVLYLPSGAIPPGFDGSSAPVSLRP